VKSLNKGNINAGIITVKVPTNGDYSTEYCQTCTSWETLEDPVEVQEALQQRNRIHFGQAKGTFPTTPLFSDHVDWMASTIAADVILEGHHPFADSTDIPDIVRELLASFKHSSPLDAVSDEVTVSEWVGKMKTWKGKMPTSPSGMHLGHHRSLIKPFIPADPTPEMPPELLELEDHRQQLLEA
jgi:hypothetical protein